MRPQVFRLGIAGLLLLSAMLWQTVGGLAQDQASLANTANSAMQRMSDNLNAALRASNETSAKDDVRAAISAGEQAVAALEELRSIATDDVVRSRSEASLTQTTNAVNKARDALNRSGDAFLSGVEAALGEVDEAIEEFAPVLERVPAPTAEAPRALPKAGAGDLTESSLIAIGLAGLALLGLGSMLRQRAAASA